MQTNSTANGANAIQTIKNATVITRHASLTQYLMNIVLIDDTATVLEHASPADIQDKDVIGVLPHSLSVLTKTFTEVPLRLPSELRGKELSVSDLEQYAGEPVTYTVNIA